MSKTINCLVDHKGAPCTCDMSMYENLNKPMSTTTQNDWEGKITMLLLRNFDNNKYQWTSAHAELKELIETLLADARKEGYEEGQISERKNHMPQMLLEDNVWSIKTVMTNGKQILTNQRFMREHEWYEIELVKMILSRMSNELIESFRKHLSTLRKESK